MAPLILIGFVVIALVFLRWGISLLRREGTGVKVVGGVLLLVAVAAVGAIFTAGYGQLGP